MTAPDDERARLRALAEKAANPELDHWQRTHALWELRAALSPPVVLALLDAADRAEAAERECKKAERLWKESSIDASRKFDTIKGLGRAVEAERARTERLEAALKPIAGWWKIWNAGGPTPDEWIVREWMQKADAALAEPAPGGPSHTIRTSNPGSVGDRWIERAFIEGPAPGGQDAEREGGA